MSTVAPPVPAETPESTEHFGMNKTDRVINLISIVVPLAAFVAAIPLLWNEWVGPTDLILLTVLYLATGLGITVGFHRLLTHRSFQSPKWVEYTFAVLGTMAVQGPVDHWVADHRKHHAHTDQEGDPHSPHVGHGHGVKGALKGLYHAHMGWLVHEGATVDRATYARDLLEDRGIRIISWLFKYIITAGLLLPFFLGWLITGELKGGLTGFLWGGLVRVALLHHVTFSINSLCHFFGTRRFTTEDHSTNFAPLSVLSFGESWHNNHHAFPRSSRHGMKWYELDPGAWTIWTLERLGLAYNVVRITPERQREKLAPRRRR